jgi:hypothetical protein
MPTVKKVQYKDRAPYSINESIEKKFQSSYNNALKNIFVNLSNTIVKFNKQT